MENSKPTVLNSGFLFIELQEMFSFSANTLNKKTKLTMTILL